MYCDSSKFKYTEINSSTFKGMESNFICLIHSKNNFCES